MNTRRHPEGHKGIKAVIGISSWVQTRDELRMLAKKIDAGKRLPEADYQLDFPSPVELLAKLPPKRLQICGNSNPPGRCRFMRSPSSLAAIIQTCMAIFSGCLRSAW